MKAFKMASLSGAVTAALALGATAGLALPLAANAAALTINGESCGSYQQASFNSVGDLVLTGVKGCEIGAVPVDPVDPTDPEPVDPEPTDPEPVDPPEPGANGIPSYCKNQNPNIGYTINGYVGAPRQTAMLTGLDDFIVKMVPGEGLGYGMTNSFETVGMTNMRTLAISECPGDFTEHLPEQGTCVAEGQAHISLRWSYDATTPAGKGQCRLEQGKTYYFNVRNATMSNLDKVDCVSGTCSSYLTSTAAPLK